MSQSVLDALAELLSGFGCREARILAPTGYGSRSMWHLFPGVLCIVSEI